MNDIEKKALALLNECGWRGAYIKRKWDQRYEALCRAIEQHEAFRQEVSEALLWHCKYTDGVLEGLQHLIIADPDPLEEALRDAAFEQQQTSAGEVPEWALERVYELWQDTSLLEAFARYIAAHEPEPVDPLVAALASIDIGLSDIELQKLKDMGVTVTAPARGEG